MAHFSRYGYEKTTVTDLAKAIGFSKAYIYKFFDSKQAVNCFSRIANCTTSPPSRRAINGLQRNSMPVICSS